MNAEYQRDRSLARKRALDELEQLLSICPEKYIREEGLRIIEKCEDQLADICKQYLWHKRETFHPGLN
jgi:hypothetical protein